MDTSKPQKQKCTKNNQSENLLLNLAFNIIIPTLILTKLSGDEYLGTRMAIVIALAFPVIYGLKDFVTLRRLNFFSILGVVSILLTGGISLMELDPVQTDRIAEALEENGNNKSFEKCLANAFWLVAGSFFLSSILNYILATVLITSQPGTVEFNEQLGKMTALSFPVIAIPAMLVLVGALFYLFRGVTKLTGLKLEEVIHHHDKHKE